MIRAWIWLENRTWSARTYKDGRCEWLQGGFRSAKKAQRAAEEQLRCQDIK